MAEQLICNQQVVGSTPITSSNEFTQRELLYGRFPEWPKGADCKSVVADFGGPNPPSPTKIETYPRGVSLFCLVMVEMRNAAAAVVRNHFRLCDLSPFTTAVHFPHLCGKFVVTNPPSPTKIETYPRGVSLFCLVMVEMRNAAAAVVRNHFRLCDLSPFTTAVHFPHLCGKFVVTNPPSPTKIETYPRGVSLFCLVMVEMRNAAAAVVRNHFRLCDLSPFTTAVHFPHLCGKFVVTNPPSPTKTSRAGSGCFTDSFFPLPCPSLSPP